MRYIELRYNEYSTAIHDCQENYWLLEKLCTCFFVYIKMLKEMTKNDTIPIYIIKSTVKYSSNVQKEYLMDGFRQLMIDLGKVSVPVMIALLALIICVFLVSFIIRRKRRNHKHNTYMSGEGGDEFLQGSIRRAAGRSAYNQKERYVSCICYRKY